MEGIVEKTRRTLLKYPLCNHCLGRLFAKLGRGLGNDLRGLSLKTILAMEIHKEIMEDPDNPEHRENLKKLAENGGGPLKKLYENLYGGEVDVKQCFICGNRLGKDFFEELASKAIEVLREYNATSFLIGVSIDRELQLKEIEVAGETGFEYSESIKNEVKREVGKLVRDKTGIEPDFEKPDIVVIFRLWDGYSVVVNPILLLGRYWKRARNISHVEWVSRGIKKYPYSIEEFLNDSLRDVYEAERIVLHASGREDVDVRMLGTGRPMVIEVKNPRFRLVDKDLLNTLLDGNLVKAVVYGYASRRHIELLKEELSKKSKTYRALVLTEDPVKQEDLRYLEEFFTDRTVKQLTPRRILRRKKERVRSRRVYRVKTRMINSRLFEALVKTDGGLYIKELISSDDGRTNPSFTSILGTQAYCIELDVVGVDIAVEHTWEKPL